MSYRLVFFAFFVEAKFSETEVLCDIDSIKIKAANFDNLNGLKIILSNDGNQENVINYQWKGVLKYVRRDSQPIGHIIRKSS